MGYFSNGTEGEIYEAEWCSRCVHADRDQDLGCAVWFAHMLHNYEHCNDGDSILHLLIPKVPAKDGKPPHNGECRMFIEDLGRDD